MTRPRGLTGPGIRCPKCAHNTVTQRGDAHWTFTQCSYCGEVFDKEPREHPVGCDCSTCLGDGAPFVGNPMPDGPRAEDPFLVEDELDGLHCPKCHEPHVWHGRTHADHWCPSCRYGE
jgi:hypothetical protein